jgi:electron transfer flavoprotein beta subunit
MLAQALGWTHVTYVTKILSSTATTLELERSLEDETEVVSVPLPVLISVGKGEVEPRFPSLLRVRKYAKAEVPVIAAAAFTNVASVVDRIPPAARKAGEIIAGPDVASKVRTLVDRLIADQAL